MSPRDPRRAPPGDPPGRAATDDDDAALFRAAIGPVRALPERAPPPAPPRPRPAARMAERDEEDARDAFRRALESPLLAGDVLSYRRNEVAPQVLRRLARGENNKNIGTCMNLSAKTISTYRGRIMEKLKTESLVEMVDLAKRNSVY